MTYTIISKKKKKLQIRYQQLRLKTEMRKNIALCISITNGHFSWLPFVCVCMYVEARLVAGVFLNYSLPHLSDLFYF